MAWLLTIAKRLSLSRLRERSRQSPAVDTDWEAVLSAHERLTPEDRITIRDLIERLNERERQIVLLRAAGGLKHREIAAALRISERTVRQRLSKANAMLREQLKEWYEDEG